MKLEINEYERGCLRNLLTKEKYELRDSGDTKIFPEYTKAINRMLKAVIHLKEEK